MKATGLLKGWKPVTADKTTMLEVAVTIPYRGDLIAGLGRYKLGDAIEITLGEPAQQTLALTEEEVVERTQGKISEAETERLNAEIDGNGVMDDSPYMAGVREWARVRKHKEPKLEIPEGLTSEQEDEFARGWTDAQDADRAQKAQGEAAFKAGKRTCVVEGCRKRKLAACPYCELSFCEEHYSDHLLNEHRAQLTASEAA